MSIVSYSNVIKTTDWIIKTTAKLKLITQKEAASWAPAVSELCLNTGDPCQLCMGEQGSVQGLNVTLHVECSFTYEGYFHYILNIATVPSVACFFNGLIAYSCIARVSCKIMSEQPFSCPLL